MQKIGRKSIVVETIIPNQLNSENPFIVRVQANKNHGICDIVVGSKLPLEVVDEKTKKTKTVTEFFPAQRVGDILSMFQGRQIDDVDVFMSLEDSLYIHLNSESHE